MTVAEGPRVSNRGLDDVDEEVGTRTSPGVVTFKKILVAAAAPLSKTMDTSFGCGAKEVKEGRREGGKRRMRE